MVFQFKENELLEKKNKRLQENHRELFAKLEAICESIGLNGQEDSEYSSPESKSHMQKYEGGQESNRIDPSLILALKERLKHTSDTLDLQEDQLS